MVKLPDMTALGGADSFIVKERLPNAGDVDASAIGRGMGAVGAGLEGVSGALEDQQKKNDALDLIKAEAAYNTGVAGVHQNLWNDIDYETQHRRALEGFQGAANDAASYIRRPDAREHFLLKTQTQNQHAALQIGHQANSLLNQQRAVDLETELQKQENIILSPDASDAAKATAHQSIQDSISVGRTSGILSPRAAEQLSNKYLFESVKKNLENQADKDPHSFLGGAGVPLSPDVQELPGQPTDTKVNTDRLVPSAQPQTQQASTPQSRSDYLAPASGKSNIKDLRSEFSGGLNAALADMPENLRSTIKIDSGFRPPEEQAEILERHLRERGIPITRANMERGLPGTVAGVIFDANGNLVGSKSEHAKGAAVDIEGSPAAMQWLYANSGRYGFENPRGLRGSDPGHFQMTAGYSAGLSAPGTRTNISPVDRDLLIRTVLGEAGNQGPLGQAAVANVILNRLKAGYNGANSVTDVVTQPHQFEALDRNKETWTTDQNSPEYQKAAQVVDSVLAGQQGDNTKGATHFYGVQSQSAMGRAAPDWASQFPKTAQVGEHAFYQEPKYAQALSSGRQTATDATYAAPPQPSNVPRLPNDMGVLSPLERQQIIDRAHANIEKFHAGQWEATKAQVQNDIDRIRDGGEPLPREDGRTSLDVAKEMAGDKRAKDFQGLQRAWNSAQYGRDLKAAVVNMPYMDAMSYIAQNEPSKSDEKIDYTAAKEQHQEALHQLEEINNTRTSDPAKSVDGFRVKNAKGEDKYIAASPLVEAAKKQAYTGMVQQLDGSWVQGPPLISQQKWGLVMDARLKAQEQAGLGPDERFSLTRTESERLLGIEAKDIHQIDPINFGKLMDAAAIRAKREFGEENAKRALEDAVNLIVKESARKDASSNAIASLATSGTIHPDVADALLYSTRFNPLTNYVQMHKMGAARTDTSLGTPAVAATNAPQQTPDKKKIEDLRQHPERWKEFDAQFGAGSAARSLISPNAQYNPAQYYPGTQPMYPAISTTRWGQQNGPQAHLPWQDAPKQPDVGAPFSAAREGTVSQNETGVAAEYPPYGPRSKPMSPLYRGVNTMESK